MKKIFSVLFGFSLLLNAGNSSAQNKNSVAPAKTPVHKTQPASNVKKPVAKAKINQPIAIDTSIRVKITTDSGIIIVKLYDSTPLHRDNFVKLVNEHFYDSLLFHRVIPYFMIQGGDPLSRNAAPGMMLGNGGGDMERIPAEFRRSIIHKKGALAGARDNNPAKASSACQFYIVEGKPYTDQELDVMEQRSGIKYSPEQRMLYKTIGGTPFLDYSYTVFGEVESGLDVITKISNVPRGQADRPNGDVHMYMEVLGRK
jgi:peptidyl-prolyl cis-trans isomerase B (cyclophilin B)